MIQGSRASTQAGCTINSKRIDALYWVRLEWDKNPAFDIVRSIVNGPPELKEVEAVLLALRGHSEVAKGREIVHEAARTVAFSSGESAPTEPEINMVLKPLHILGIYTLQVDGGAVE